MAYRFRPVVYYANGERKAHLTAFEDRDSAMIEARYLQQTVEGVSRVAIERERV